MQGAGREGESPEGKGLGMEPERWGFEQQRGAPPAAWLGESPQKPGGGGVLCKENWGQPVVTRRSPPLRMGLWGEVNSPSALVIALMCSDAGRAPRAPRRLWPEVRSPPPPEWLRFPQGESARSRDHRFILALEYFVGALLHP